MGWREQASIHALTSGTDAAVLQLSRFAMVHGQVRKNEAELGRSTGRHAQRLRGMNFMWLPLLFMLGRLPFQGTVASRRRWSAVRGRSLMPSSWMITGLRNAVCLLIMLTSPNRCTCSLYGVDLAQQMTYPLLWLAMFT